MSVTLSKTFRACLSAATALVIGVGCGDAKKSSLEEEIKSGAEFPHSVTREAESTKTQVAPISDEMPVVPEAPVVEPVQPGPVPTTYSELMQEGRRLMGEGSYAEALAMFERAADKSPKHGLPRLQMARALLAQGDHAQARGHVEAALELSPESSDAWNALGRVELAEGDREAAIASFQRAVDEDEDNSYAWNNLGFALIEDAKYEEASHALERATSGGKPATYMWNNLGMAYEHLDMIAEARAAYRQAADGGSAKAQANLARLEGVVSLKRRELDAGPAETESEPAPVKDETPKTEGETGTEGEGELEVQGEQIPQS